LLVTTGVGVADAGTEAVSAALVGSTKVGVSERVALPELGGTTVALLAGAGEGVDAGTSEAGTLLDWIGDGVAAGTDDTPDPEMPEGKIPDVVSLAAGGVRPEDTALGVVVGVSLGSRDVMLAGSEGVGTTPDGVGIRPEETVGRAPEGMRPEEAVGMTPEGIRPEEISDAMLDTMLLAGGRGTGTLAVGSSETKLDTMLGRTDTGTSEIAPDKRLETSETKEETSGGRMPDGAADGAGVGAGETGAVGPAEPEGRMPVTSETSEDKIEGRLSGPDGRTASEVGIAPELNTGLEALSTGAPVPSAVVMPTTIPPEDGWIDKGCWLDRGAGAGVGCTTPLLGRTPVEPTSGLGDAAGTFKRDDRRPPTRPCEVVG
jgi:hypothetical protein